MIFDVDGVLIDSFEANLNFFQNLFNKAGYIRELTREEAKKLFHLPMKDLIRNYLQLNDENELERIFKLGKEYVANYPNHLLTFPVNYQAIIKKLAQEYTLGIVTSRVRGGVFRIPQLNALKEYFKILVYFEDTLKHKPDPEPLLLALKKLEVKPEEAVYIGDMPSDIEAAKSAGMKIIIYSILKLDGADATTSSFEELLNLIRTLKLNK